MKKQFFLLSACLLLSATVWSQTKAKISKSAIQKATNEVVSLYKMDEAQAKEVYQIQEVRLQNLQAIEYLRQEDYAVFLRKRAAIRIGAEHAIKNLLTTAQLEIFNIQKAEKQKRETDKMRTLKMQGASREAIQLALLEIE